MYGETLQPQYTPVPQQQQVDLNMDDILKQGLARYISTRPNVPDALAGQGGGG
jgi:hypothetical protein